MLSADPNRTVGRIAELLSGLLGRDVDKKTLDAKVKLSFPVLCASYRNDGGKVVAVILADVPFAVNAACAMAMMPPAAAKDAIQGNDLSGTIGEGAREVMNVLAQVCSGSGSAHAKLGSVELLRDAAKLPAQAKTPAKLTLELRIQGYGSGQLWLHT